MILVKVGKLGGKMKEYAVNDGTLINMILSIAGISIDMSKEEVHVMLGGSSVVASLATALTNGSIVVVEPKSDPLLNDVTEYIYDNFDVDGFDKEEVDGFAKDLIDMIRGK